MFIILQSNADSNEDMFRFSLSDINSKVKRAHKLVCQMNNSYEFFLIQIRYNTYRLAHFVDNVGLVLAVGHPNVVNRFK